VTSRDGAIFRRNLERRLRDALADTPVVVLTGARQTGKTTLVQRLIGPKYRARYVTFDDLATRAAARSDPRGFLEGEGRPLIVDEVQHAPDLLPAIKEVVDRHREPGSFVLTGSANVLLLPQISESLAGRSEYLTLWPLSQGELARREERFLDHAFDERAPRASETGDLRRDSLRRALRGGFPEAIRRDTPARRGTWFTSYVTGLLERDVRSLANIEQLSEMPDLLAILAARSAGILNASELARVTGMNIKTLTRYLALLERLYLVRRLPAWSGGLATRAIQHPKIVLTDSGLLAHLQGVELERYQRDPVLAGALLETFVIGELERQRGWNATDVRLHHYRSYRGEEVDLVLERRDGEVVGVEVKARATPDASDFRGLRALASLAPRKFRRGIVLYTGHETIPFGKDLAAVPVSSLWKW